MNCVYIGLMALGYGNLNWDKSRNRFLKIWWSAGSCMNSKVAFFSCTMKALTRRCPNTGPFLKLMYDWAFLVAQMVKNLPAMQETWVWSMGQEDPLEGEMTTYSSILAWRIPWTEEPGRLQSMRSQRVRHDWVTNTFTFTLERQNYFNVSGIRLLLIWV